MTRRIAFLIGLLCELVAVFVLFLPSQSLLKTGTPITLQTIPVDPRSIFRGDYVTLDYEVGQNLPPILTQDQPLYVVLEQKGDVYERVSTSQFQPTLGANQVCLVGTTNYQRVTFPDIAQYFVSEGQGHELEQARNAHRLLVDVRVNANCRSIIQGIHLGPELPSSELEPMFNGMPVGAPMMKVPPPNQ